MLLDIRTLYTMDKSEVGIIRRHKGHTFIFIFTINNLHSSLSPCRFGRTQAHTPPLSFKLLQSFQEHPKVKVVIQVSSVCPEVQGPL
ncbi:hypothetical protein HanXRQr2_Chr14g0660371 [Helianthus annuus]|uniref:Uncharacterized protein n=2 Tax=Helianthus annuus TaxID=4232 RepID=A0A9K3ECA3_HELAN|nr:hypothetical protein HanXRQr2_Chr14g0660371 [Helianthus annuus]